VTGFAVISKRVSMCIPTRRLEYHADKGTIYMQVEVTKKLFTVAEYYQMAAAGILGPDDRVELIDGEIIQMSPIGDRHVGHVNRLTHVFVTSFAVRAVVSIQSPIQLNNYTEPEPDVLVLKPRPDYYVSKKVRAEDALLIVEVADTTLRYDRDIKVPKYAAAGIPEVWIESLSADELLVYRDPAGAAYATSLTLHRGDSVSAIAFPDVVFKVEDILG
jgi:Uma2 family endonuclease